MFRSVQNDRHVFKSMGFSYFYSNRRYSNRYVVAYPKWRSIQSTHLDFGQGCSGSVETGFPSEHVWSQDAHVFGALPPAVSQRNATTEPCGVGRSPRRRAPWSVSRPAPTDATLRALLLRGCLVTRVLPRHKKEGGGGGGGGGGRQA